MTDLQGKVAVATGGLNLGPGLFEADHDIRLAGLRRENPRIPLRQAR